MEQPLSSFGLMMKEKLFDYLSRCDIGIITLPNNLSYRLNPAAKFFDYISVGLPIVMNNIGGWG